VVQASVIGSASRVGSPRAAQTLPALKKGSNASTRNAAVPDTFAQHLGVDIGTRCAYLDLRNADDLGQMHERARNAAVTSDSDRKPVSLPHRVNVALFA
jgi:hypothetical protein